MVRSVFFAVVTALLAVMASSVEAKRSASSKGSLVSYSLSKYPTISHFCEGWRDNAVSYAGSMCKHHEMTCVSKGANQSKRLGYADVWAGYVPFSGDQSHGCNTKFGPAKGPVTDMTGLIAHKTGAKVLGKVKRDQLEKRTHE